MKRRKRPDLSVVTQTDKKEMTTIVGTTTHEFNIFLDQSSRRENSLISSRIDGNSPNKSPVTIPLHEVTFAKVQEMQKSHIPAKSISFLRFKLLCSKEEENVQEKGEAVLKVMQRLLVHVGRGKTKAVGKIDVRRYETP